MAAMLEIARRGFSKFDPPVPGRVCANCGKDMPRTVGRQVPNTSDLYCNSAECREMWKRVYQRAYQKAYRKAKHFEYANTWRGYRDAEKEKIRQDVLKEAANIAWLVGIREYNAANGTPMDARDVGAACALAIRAKIKETK